ncbi:hypothetical protein BT69DRAFT_1313057 [Atractiella rhizophila]|nr:hypothetical protein BT69DRAFT_1313057 [Atractiella rhizophila]
MLLLSVALTLLPFSLSLPIPVPKHGHVKRIAQVISDATKDWEQACLTAGGGQQCNPLSQTAFSSLLAAGDKCAQQNAADDMVSLAKTLNNDSEMIRLAQLFVQQPRNAPDSLQVPYCNKAPENVELDGLFHCQFAGSDFTKFSGDQTANVPLGVSTVNPPGSCPANLDDPVPDGVQLNTITSDPGVANASTSGTVADTGVGKADTSASDAGDDDEDCVDKDEGNGTDTDTSATTSSTPAPVSTSATSTGAVASGGSVQAQNAADAQKLNVQFATLTSASTCDPNVQAAACVNGAFAQCVGSSFVVSSACSAGTECFALPLVNSRGTSVTCTTQGDAQRRFDAAGVTGGPLGQGSTTSTGIKVADESNTAAANSSPPPTTAGSTATPAVTSEGEASTTTGSPSGTPFQAQNKLDAQALNTKFASLTTSSTCDTATLANACVGGAFAQCVGTNFVTTPCTGGTSCFALPLVNKAGTSVTCTTETDARSRGGLA